MKKVQIALFSLLALATAITVGCGDSASLPIFKQMAFLSNREVSPSTPLFLMNVDGTNVVPVPTSNSDLYSPSISADGKTIAYSSDGNVWVSDAAATTETQLTSTNNSWESKISPDGKKIVYIDWDNTADAYNQWVMKSDGTGAINLSSSLTTSSSSCYSGSFSADSKKIIFSCYTSSSTSIYTVNADGTGLTSVYTQDAYCDTPVFSPDGKQILFISFGVPAPGAKARKMPPMRKFHAAKGIKAADATTYGLVSINSDGSNLSVLAVGAYEAEVLNATLYYTIYNSDLEAAQIYMSNLDGSNAVALTDGSSYSYLGTSTD